MAQLMEDRSKREEISDERVREGEAQEREVKVQMDAMQTHMESLMKMVESTKAPSVMKAVIELSGVKLVPLTERDDIEAYLVTFEHIMQASTKEGRHTT